MMNQKELYTEAYMTLHPLRVDVASEFHLDGLMQNKSLKQY